MDQLAMQIQDLVCFWAQLRQITEWQWGKYLGVKWLIQGNRLIVDGLRLIVIVDLKWINVVFHSP